MNFRILPLVLLSAVSFAGGAGSAQAAEPIRLRVTAAGHTLTATLLDNATARAFAARLPLTLHMKDLFAREMCHNLRKGLPAEEAGTSGYEVGDITYWLPMKSFVIMYRQNGEVISSMQKVGRIDKGVEIFARTGDTDVTFELLEP